MNRPPPPMSRRAAPPAAAPRLGPPSALGAWIATLLLVLAACRTAPPKGVPPTAPPSPGPPASATTGNPGVTAAERFEFTRPQMGVPFRLVFYGTDAARAAAAADAAFGRVAQLNRIFSDYDPDSEANLLCHETPVGQPVPVSPDLWHVLERSQRLAADTDGAFDVTLGPVVQLWRRARRHRELPPPHLLEPARQRAGWRNLRLDPRQHTVTFAVPGMRLDFGGIAKGYAADEALRVLRAFGFPRALVAAAGDVTVGDPPPDRPGWTIDIGLLDTPNAPPARTLSLAQASVATSGDIFQHLEFEGRRYSHILDPRTGLGLTDQSLVSVIATDGLTADSLATAVSVLGPEAGLRLVERTRDAAALILRAPAGEVEEARSRRLHRWLKP